MLGLLAIAMPIAALADECDSPLQSLAQSQRAKFRLTAGPCPAPVQHVTPARAAPEHEARHLQLFDAAGTVTVLGQPVPLAPAATAGAEPARTPVQRGTRTKPTASALRAMRLAADVDVVARRHDIDPLLLHAIAHVESRHNPQARSPAGARGVMQVMPATAKRFGVHTVQALLEPSTNLEVSASYLKTLQKRFGNNLTLVLAAYNAGEGAVERYGRRVPPYRETQGYVRQVLEHYRTLTAAARRSASL